MKTTMLEAPPVGVSIRLLDFLALTKPRIAVMVLFTVAIGSMLATRRNSRST